MTDKTDVVFLARANSPIEAVRIGGVEVPVMSASPSMQGGEVCVSITLRNVRLESETIASAPAASSASNG